MDSFDGLIKQIEMHKEKGFILEAYHQGEAFKRYELIEKGTDRWLILYGERNKGIPLCESWLECPSESSIQKMIEEQEKGVVYPNENNNTFVEDIFISYGETKERLVLRIL